MRRFAALTTFVTLFALAAGCSSGASAQEIVSKAPKATIDASTAKVSLELTVTGAGLPSTTATGEGDIDFGRQASAMTLDVTDLLAGLDGAGEAVLEMRILESVTYVRSPLFAPGSRIPAGRWFKLDSTELSKLAGIDLSPLQRASHQDTRRGLALLEGVTDGDVENVGADEVRGVPTTRYAAEVNDPRDDEAIQLDVWIDGDNRVRRLEVPLSVPYESGRIQAMLTTEFWDFGSEVDVGHPPETEVVDLAGGA